MNTGINDILEKLSTLSGRESVSLLEKDLMLQYTRELYECILTIEPAAAVATSPSSDQTATAVITEASQAPVTSAPEARNNVAPEPEPTQAEPDANTTATPSEALSAASNATTETSATAITAATETPIEDEENIPTPSETSLKSVPPSVQATASEHTGMPQDEIEPDQIEEQDEPDAPIQLSANERPFREPEDFELEPELKNEKVFDPKHLVDFRLWNRDIRSYIGINDKYNFISELFDNNAEAYEEILNEINDMESAEEARYFLENSGVTTLYKWNEEGFSEQIFYNVLNQFFSAR